MTDEELVAEIVARATAAGEACGLYLESAVPLGGPDGLTKPLQLVVRYRAGDRAWLAEHDVEADAQRQVEVEDLERAVGFDEVEALRRQDADGPLGILDRGDL